jgi:hypothetical protein
VEAVEALVEMQLTPSCWAVAVAVAVASSKHQPKSLVVKACP